MNNTRRRRARTRTVLATAAVAMLALAGCAGSDPGAESGAPTSPAADSTSATSPAATDRAAGPAEGSDADLSVTITSNGTDVAHRYRLVCVNGSPVEGTEHPQAEAACTFLGGAGKSVLTTTPKKQAQCTQQIAGPQTAIIEGTLNGTSVQRAFSLTDGCKISAWKSAEALLGRGTASGAQ